MKNIKYLLSLAVLMLTISAQADSGFKTIFHFEEVLSNSKFDYSDNLNQDVAILLPVEMSIAGWVCIRNKIRMIPASGQYAGEINCQNYKTASLIANSIYCDGFKKDSSQARFQIFPENTPGINGHVIFNMDCVTSINK